ncbi:MAG: site-2 protease family protein [Marinosulfonomonas sp.]|nr:site-2 protease family protein [Marinosulfonomonas sp.]
MFSNAVKIFTLNGFDIKLDPSWALIAALITWSLSQHYFPSVHPDQTGTTYVVMALAAMLCFFASLLLHELAHSVVARRFGMRIKSITLFLFGGLAETENEPQSAGVEFWVALAGPAMSLCLGAGFWLLSAITARIAGLQSVTAVFSYLAVINLVLALFNMVPAFPLDGGRVLRAYLWNKTGDPLQATETAAKSGMAFAYVLMGLGLFALFQGAVVSALWQMMIGGFLLVAARSSYQTQLARSVFGKRTVAEIMHRDPIVVSPDATLTEFVNTIILHEGITFVPVVENRVLLGHIDQSMVSKIDRENWASTRVGDIFIGLDEAATIPADTSVQDLLARISSTGTRKFLVASGHNLLGVISLADLVRYLNWSAPSRPT